MGCETYVHGQEYDKELITYFIVYNQSTDGSIETKSKSTWVEMFDMIYLTVNSLQQQNKELRENVNDLSSKINKECKYILIYDLL